MHTKMVDARVRLVKRRAATQCTKFDIVVPKMKRQKSQCSVTDAKDIHRTLLNTSPQCVYPDCRFGKSCTVAHKAAGSTLCSLKSAQWPASPALDHKLSSPLNVCRAKKFKFIADEAVSSTSALNTKPSSVINSKSYRPVEIKHSAYSLDYKLLSSKISLEIHSFLRRGVKAFWLQSDTEACCYLFDLQTMQRHNINTGYRRPIRFKGLELIDLTDDSNATHKSNLSSAFKGSVCGHAFEGGWRASVCGHAFEGGWRCGQIADKKLAAIRQLSVQRSPLISDLSRLPESQQLFDPAPIAPGDPRFPIEQIKHLECGGLTVHEVRPTRMWKRNRSHFDLLHQEEKDYFKAFKDAKNKLKLVHFAWHGAPAESIMGILECGFLSVPSARVGRVYGHGIYLSAESNAQYSMRERFSVPDSKGFRYLLLCEILPGSAEVSERGQTHPRSNIMHSGVDHMPASMHIFWTYDMNTRISPKYVVCIHPEVTVDILNNVRNN